MILIIIEKKKKEKKKHNRVWARFQKRNLKDSRVLFLIAFDIL